MCCRFLSVAMGFLCLTALLACQAGGDSGTAAPASVPGRPDVDAGKVTFERICMACHTVGQGDRIGPDLKAVSGRRERDWLRRWLRDPIGMGQSDATGRKLMIEWKNVPMPNPNLTDQQIEDVLAYIDAMSGGAATLPASQPAPGEAALKPTAAADPEATRKATSR